MSETDPQVGTLYNGKWCTSNGSRVNCTSNAPSMSETDPQVGILSYGKWCTSNGSRVNCTSNAPADKYIGKSGTHNAGGNLNMGSHKITGLANPTVSTDAVTKSYVDAAVSAAGGGPGNWDCIDVSKNSYLCSYSHTSKTVSCPSGRILVSGGCDGSLSPRVSVHSSTPVNNGWKCAFTMSDGYCSLNAGTTHAWCCK